MDVSKEVKLYVIASPVGPYYRTGFNPVSLYADTENKRACPGGVGAFKVGGNYGSTIAPAKEAMAKGYNQVRDGTSEASGLLSGVRRFWQDGVGETVLRELASPLHLEREHGISLFTRCVRLCAFAHTVLYYRCCGCGAMTTR